MKPNLGWRRHFPHPLGMKEALQFFGNANSGEFETN